MARAILVDVSLDQFSDAEILQEFLFRGLETPQQREDRAARERQHRAAVEQHRQVLERVHRELTRFGDVAEAKFVLEREIA